jgi:hypothetical protein
METKAMEMAAVLLAVWRLAGNVLLAMTQTWTPVKLCVVMV